MAYLYNVVMHASLNRFLHYISIIGVTIFLAAFLAFQIEPLLGRAILPLFGGSSAAWAASLLFFQTALLVGYLYAYAVSRMLSPRKGMLLHGALLVASLAFLPTLPKEIWTSLEHYNPVIQIIILLFAAVGIPYAIASATSPLLQSWLGQRGKEKVYTLYALSNAGSLGALLSYPIFFEPYFPLTSQSHLWSVLYIAFLACWGIVLTTLFTSAKNAPTGDNNLRGTNPPRISTGQLARWTFLSAAGAAILVSVSNRLTQDIAPIPLLWVLPLALYLLSFIIPFSGRFNFRRGYIVFFVFSLFYLALLSAGGPWHDIIFQVFVYSVILTAACLVCHNELYALRPQFELESFYCALALGGALGGVFSALIAPLIFSTFAELHTVLILLSAYCLTRTFGGQKSIALLRFSLMGALFFLAASFYFENFFYDTAIARVRNFYGVLKVAEKGKIPETRARYLVSGGIWHGLQFLDPARRSIPTAYYGVHTGIGLLLTSAGKRPLRVGAVGLGAGTIAVYGKSTDYYRFYELNPEVSRIATSYFTFLSDSRARTDVILGDARLSLERESPQNFDVVVLDAFSSDSIPTHLLTREAFRIYEKHLAKNGVVAVHISNRHLDLKPVIRAHARERGFRAVHIENYNDETQGVWASDWIFLGKPDSPLLKKIARFDFDHTNLNENAHTQTWTDEYSNIFGIVRY